MFAKLRDQLREKRAARAKFSELVSPAVVHELREGGPRVGELKEARIEFLIGLVDGDTPRVTSQRITELVETAVAHGAETEFVGSLVLLTFGAFPYAKPHLDCRPSLVLALKQRLGASIKVVHGVALGYHGLMGSNDRGVLRYSFILPHLDEVLRTLSRIQFGQYEELCSVGGQPGVPPNGGPATSGDNSNAPGGPPS
jgi:hypothetical protein